MESLILPVAAARTGPPPIPQIDLRPNADTAALRRNPQRDIPLPIPASIGQKGAVAQAQIETPFDAIGQVERVLKPYGVVMLPHGPAANRPTDGPQIAAPAPDTQADDTAASTDTRPDASRRT